MPMLRNVFPGTEPNAVVLASVVEKFDQPDRLGRPANQAVVQRDTHDLRNLFSFLVQKVEAVDQVSGEFVSRAKPVVLVKTIVIGLE